MKLTGMHHTGITVRNLEMMVEFYTKHLGLELLLETDSIAPLEGNHTGIPGARRKLVFLGFGDGHQIELVHYIDPPAGDGHLDRHQLGCTHVCFTVDDIDAVYHRLKNDGVRFVTEPKYTELDDQRTGVVYGQDPEGNWFELLEVRPKT